MQHKEQVWISALINFDFCFRYDFCCMEREMTTRDILREKVGVCRQYVKIFSEMCDLSNIRVKCIRGFARGYNQVPGKNKTP